MQRTCVLNRRISAELRWGWFKFPLRLRERSRKGLMNKLPRSWVAIDGGTKRTSTISSSRPQPGFKVLQWNVLADGLAQNGNFTNVPSEVLEWNRRWPLILSEIQEADADVICLQEVNKYDDFFRPALEKAGYQSYYLPKLNSPATKYGAPRDGCAVFYKSSRFQLKQEPLGKAYISRDGSLMNQGFIILSLVDSTQNREFILATTHLKAKNGIEEEETRIHQVNQLLNELNELRSESYTNGSTIPVIVCGDFNAEPNAESVHIMRKNYPFNFVNLWDFKTNTPDEKSVITTFKWRDCGLAKRVIDYVWFTTCDELELIERWSMLSDEQIGENGLPAQKYGSDHVALCARFAWT
eukprot:g2827.t1